MAPPTAPRPSWQSQACPPWCVVRHRESDQPDDRVHESPARSLPVTAHDARTTELLLALSRPDASQTDWVFVGEARRDGQHLHLSRESALALAGALGDLLSTRSDA
jgi:hypothetical protein